MAGKSAALASISFSCLVFYAIKTMKKVMVSLDETTVTLAEVRESALGVTQEASSLIHTLNVTVQDVKGRITTVDPLLESAHDAGEVLHQISHSVKEAFSGVKQATSRSRSRPRPLSMSPVRIKVGSQEEEF